MKPRKRPGQVIVGAHTHSKGRLLSREEVAHLKGKESPALRKKEGRGGHRADWDIDYEKGIEYAKAKMPDRECENFSQEGIRRIPKKGGRR